jgi:hypothetical protein
LEIDELCLRPGERFEHGDVICGEDAIPLHREPTNHAKRTVHGNDFGVVINRVSSLSCQRGCESKEEKSFHPRQPAVLTFREDDGENVM